MRQSIIAVKSGEDFIKATPYVYVQNRWVPCQPKVRMATMWQDIGGVGRLFYNFFDSNNAVFIDNNNNNFLIAGE